MAEAAAPSKIRGWIKAGVTSIMGLISGAILMYVSPLVTSAIKPGKPLVNFSHQIQGLTVAFQNRATGATEGWWDFGDGSPLQPFSPTQETITHTFGRLATYNVKLSLRSFLGEESERAVPVVLDGNAGGTPVIEVFNVEPIKPDAPATFRVASQIKNADLCIWALGEERPLEVSSDTSPIQERYVTIKEPGFYTLRLVAVNGKQTAEKAVPVFVNVGDGNSPGASLQVTFQVVPVHKVTKEVNLQAAFPAERKEQVFPFQVAYGEPDCKIVAATFAKPAKETFVQNPGLAISADKTKVVLTGELVKPGGIMAWQKNAPPLKWTPTVILTMEKRESPVMKTSDPIAADLKLPGTTFLPMPKMTSRWEVKGTNLNLELRDGSALVFKDSKLPINAPVQFKNHPYRLTATQGPDSIRLDIIDARATLRPAAN